MKRTLLAIVLTTCLSAQAATFNYHGNLQDAGKPAEGRYDIELTLYSAADGGKVVAGPLTVHEVDVHDGSFSTEVGFPSLGNVPQQAWLGVRVRGAGDSEFATLGARASIGVDAVASSVCPGAWTLDGNAGNAAGSYLGTADNQPLIFKVNGQTAGQITPGKGVSFSQGQSFFGASANGADSFAMGEGTGASGTASFAGGFGAFANQNGTYMWGDSNVGTGGITATTAANQYIVRAGGGVAINGAPFGEEFEFTIRPSRIKSTGSDSSNLFMGGKSTKGGIALMAYPNTAAANNDAAFYLERLDGAGTNAIDMSFTGNGDMYIYANAYKPGGGTWSATSDRRVKQDIAPIENAVDTLLKLRPVSFHYTPEYRAMEGGLADKPYLGFVAQEFADVFPDAVTSTGQHVPGAAKDAKPILALDPNPALITAVAAVQELAVQSQDDEGRVAKLEAENIRLHRQLDALSARLSALENAKKGE